jgi:hypothetical protein
MNMNEYVNVNKNEIFTGQEGQEYYVILNL